MTFLFFRFRIADIISTVEFSHNGELLATGDKGGRIVIFQRDNAVSVASFSENIFGYRVGHFNIVWLAFVVVLKSNFVSLGCSTVRKTSEVR